MRHAILRSGWKIEHHRQKQEPPGYARSRSIYTSHCEPLPPTSYPVGFGHRHPLDPSTRPLGTTGVPRDRRFPRISPPAPVLTIHRFGSLRIQLRPRIESHCRRPSVLPLAHYIRGPGNKIDLDVLSNIAKSKSSIRRPLEKVKFVFSSATRIMFMESDRSPEGKSPGGGGRRG